MKRLNNQGFAHAALAVLIVAVVSVVGFTGYTVYQHNKSNAGGPSTVGANVCGPGYGPLTSGNMGGGGAIDYGGNSKVSGTALLFKNASAGKVCLINVSRGAYGTKKFMTATVNISKSSSTSVSGGSVVRRGTNDSGQFSYYAGPVYVKYSDLNTSKYCINVLAGISYGGAADGANNCVTLGLR